MKKILFFVWLMLFACVFANAQTVDTLDKAKNDYLFGNGAYTVGSDEPRTVNISFDSPNVGDIETGETVKVLVTLDSPAENWDVLTEPTLAEISNSGIWSQYVFEIILVAGNILGNDTFKLVGDGEIELTFNVVAPKKNFTVTANGETIDPTEPLNLNEFSGNGFVMQVYDDQGGLVKTTQFTFVDPVPVEGDIVVSRQKMTEYINIYKSSGSGKAKIEIKKDGYNDFVFYVTYTEPEKKNLTVTANGETIDPEKPLNLNEFSGNGFKMQVYDDQGGLVKTTQFTLTDPIETVEGNLVVSRQKMTEYINIYKSSGSGKAKIEIKKDGYNDFVFYVTYTEPKKDFTVTDPNGETMHNGDIFTLTEDMKGKDLTITINSKAANYSPMTVSGEMPITTPVFSYDPILDQKTMKFRIKTPSVDGKFQIKFTLEGYNDFIGYLEYTTPFVPVEKIVLSRTSGTLEVGQTGQLTATVLPEDAANKEVIWKSKDESVATVDQNGLVTAVGAGTTYIGAFSKENEKIFARCKVTVKNVPVKKIKLSRTSGTLYVGKTGQLTATVLPEDAANKEVIWKSQDESIATVDQNGLVTGVSEGTTYIGAFSKENEKIYAVCKVKVKNISVKKIVLSRTYGILTVGQTGQLTATVLPENATDKEVIWKSNDETVATVDAKGLVTGVGEGTTYIYAISKENEKIRARCKVKVKNNK